ncbi:hypothetical protein FEM48_Zijuj04G0150400 [Ziziphus jujuba var. spinosa]|uniref:SWIM-type domain-containing protein n=1 Tax=Ziziphus jujuba var. spinosa TaxID=714518 RepID=A0A978VKJ5_ZIZJJ|nr:hypothetical protein FEM48_Zijuj04G0150400 [Ziziphus jujuba var. spinosa]
MDIDLRLPSGEHDKEGEEPTGIDNMLDNEEKLHNGDIETGNMVDIVDDVRAEDGGDLNSPTTDIVVFKEDTNLEPLSGMEFESHGEAYSFYQEYARSMGFNTAIQNSRRSKTSREFIDAKFACSRYGTKREYDKSFNRPRSRQNKQDPENATGRRSCSKTDCKASMHVKRRPDGKWVIHNFVKEHNHELLPAQAVTENLGHVIKRHENFIAKFEKCIHRSWTIEEFEKRWWKILEKFELKEDEWMQLLYEDRKQWVPTFMRDAFLAGMSTVQRSESVNCFFDKYVHKKTTVQEFLKQYEAILQDRYEEEAKADSDTWNKQPTLKSPSPLEKSVSGVYTHAVFKKFQVEVLGAVACHPKRERQDETGITFRVQDFERNLDFIVLWNEMKSEVSCLCRLFEYKGYLCRHAMIVLQICGLSAIPSQYILKRWTKDAKNRHLTGEESDHLQSRVQRYNDLCQRAIKLTEEGSISQESYSIACRALDEAFSNCVSVNNSSKSLVEASTSTPHGLLCIEEDNQNKSMGKQNKKKNPTKKRKVSFEPDVMAVGAQDSLQQMDKLNSRTVTLDGYYGAQQSVQGMVQLNLMAPTRDNYYGNQQTIQGLGQLNSIAPSHDGYYGTQQSMHGLGQMDFFRAPGFAYNIRDDPNVRTAALHDDTSRHGMDRSQNPVENAMNSQDNVNAGGVNENMIVVMDGVHNRDGGLLSSPKRDVVMFEGDTDFEPCNGIEFESHEAAYSFYQEYAKSMGFTTSIKNSRRSKKSKEFIDAKFACSRYGVTPESDGGSSRRPSVKKTDCKASMHVKRRSDGKWIIHEFIKEHNHELLPALAYHFRIHRNVKLVEKNNIDILHAVSERTRKMYVEMSRQSGGYQNIGFVRAETDFQFDKGRYLGLEEGDAQYGSILQNRYEEEAIADFDTWHKQPALKSPSPWEKQMSTVYTHAVFKKFQVEVLGVVGCQPKKESEDGATITFRVQDCEKDEFFFVLWNETKSEVSCFCRLFEYKGFLCRHALIVLQICGLSSIPPHYILKRWTKDAKGRTLMAEGTERTKTRVQRYNDLCKHAIELSEEGSLSEETYNIAFRALVEALRNCVDVNNHNNNAVEYSTNVHGVREMEEENQGSLVVKTSRKKNTNKKRKVQADQDVVLVEEQDTLQQMDNLSSDSITLNGYYGAQQNVQGLVQLNLMEPPHDSYYVNQQSIQGLGQLNSIAPGPDSYFGAQQGIHALGQLDFRPPTSFGYSLQDEPHLRSAQLHGNASRHT